MAGFTSVIHDSHRQWRYSAVRVHLRRGSVQKRTSNNAIIFLATSISWPISLKERYLEKFFSIFYFSSSAGAFIASILTPFLRGIYIYQITALYIFLKSVMRKCFSLHSTTVLRAGYLLLYGCWCSSNLNGICCE